MPQPWAGGAQARIIGELHGQTTINVMHFATNEGVNDGEELDTILLGLATALKECVIDVLLPGVSQDWKFVRTDARRIYPTPSDPIIATGLPEHVGELSVTSTSFAASLLSIRTGGAGRRGRGRIFLPPAGEAEISQSALDAPTLVLLAAFAACLGTKFMGASPTSNWHLGVLSRANLAGLIGNFNNSFRPAVSLNPVADVAVMRSRRKGRGV
jgi:hypothetical protein